MKIGEIYITKCKRWNTLAIDKILFFDDNSFISNYVNYKLEYGEDHNNYHVSYIIISSLDDYFQNPEKYPELNYNQILNMWKKFMENDIVEARKYKLKLLENYGN